MLKVQPFNASMRTSINFAAKGRKNESKDEFLGNTRRDLQSLTPLQLMTYYIGASNLYDKMSAKSTQNPQELETIQTQRDMAYQAIRTLPSTVSKRPALSIWGDLNLDLQDNMRLPASTKAIMSRDIAKVLSGETKMKEVVNPNVWSISYEYTNKVGGQTDIAREQPEAMNKAGINTIAVAPMHKMSVKGKPVNYLEQGADGNLYYVTPNDRTKVEKVYEGELQTSDRMDEFSVYYGEYGPNKQKTLFLYDDDMFNFGDTDSGMVYQDLPHSAERVRMAQFNNMTYEALAKAKEGKLKLPDGTQIPFPDKMVAHEAWQSAGLLQKMRLYSRAEDTIYARPRSTTDYLRELANNTAVIVHNLGNAYQGQSGNKKVMEDYFNVLYNDFAHDIVENSCITDVSRHKFGLFNCGNPSQRLGFFADVLNPAHAGIALATTFGPVSEGYGYELINTGISSKLDEIVKLKNKYHSIAAFPNGVDKKTLAATTQNVDKLNKDLGTNALAYLDTVDDKSENINFEDFVIKKEHNKKLFVDLLKNAAANNETPCPYINNNAAPKFYEGKSGIDISDITADTPIFSMASRLDSQKGFTTMIDAYAKLAENMDADSPNFPVLVISGGGDNKIAAYIENVKDKLGNKGKKILFTQNRISDSGLLLMNMTTRHCMPSDFEPYGISDAKGFYAGSHGIVNEVGGMKSFGNISRKIYALGDYDIDTANAITVKDYEFECIADKSERPEIRDRNSTKLMQAMKKDIALSKEDSYKMDLNALMLDVSWDKGAIQNYMDIMKIKAA